MTEKCPRCGNAQAAPILHGKPALDEETEAGQKLGPDGESEEGDSLERVRKRLAGRSAEYFMFMDD